MAKKPPETEQEENERVSLYIPRELYLKYYGEVVRQKMELRNRGASLNQLVIRAMEAYKNRF